MFVTVRPDDLVGRLLSTSCSLDDDVFDSIFQDENE